MRRGFVSLSVLFMSGKVYLFAAFFHHTVDACDVSTRAQKGLCAANLHKICKNNSAEDDIHSNVRQQLVDFDHEILIYRRTLNWQKNCDAFLL